MVSQELKLTADLKRTIKIATTSKYSELYEKKYTDSSLSQSIEQVISSMANSSLGNKRLIWLLLLLTIFTDRCISYYAYDSKLLNIATRYIKILFSRSIILETSFVKEREHTQYRKLIEEEEKVLIHDFDQELFILNKKKINVLSFVEALSIMGDLNAFFKNKDFSIEVFVRLNSNIVEDLIEGQVLLPDSNSKRMLFNWWLLEVIPCSYHFLYPRINF